MADYNSDRTGSNIDLTLDKVDALDAKVQPTATGANVTGTITADGLVVDKNYAFQGANYHLKLGEDSGDSYLGSFGNGYFSATGYYYGSNKYQLTGGSTNLTGYAATSDFTIFAEDGLTANSLATSKARLRIDGATGDVSFYEDTGTTAKFVWDASAESLGIGTSSPEDLLHVNKNGAGEVILAQFENGTNAGGTSASIKLRNHTDVCSTVLESHRSGADFGADFVIKTSNGVSGTIDERFRITEAGNVGIGTAIPTSALHIKNTTGNNGLRIETASTDNGYIHFASPDNDNVGRVVYSHLDNSMTFVTADAERARIDSSGNLLVGTTDAEPWNNSSGTNSDNGAVVGSAYLSACQRNNASLRINRTGTDGDLQVFYKDGSTVGSIGSYAGQFLTIGTGDSGLLFQDDANEIIPRNSGGAVSDANLNLGAVTSRFKDLYLSGGVYLGGTGAANKLDDYEEGSWTATCGTFSTAPGSYIKVGRVVFIKVLIQGTGSGDEITGLPFTPDNAYAGALSIGASSYATITDSDGTPFQFFVGTLPNSIRSRQAEGAGAAGTMVGSSSITRILITGSYETNA